MKKSISILTLLLILSISIHSQDNYPTNYFQKPMKIPHILSGTFGELRSNHFHAGIDIKTNGKEGYNVYAAAEGYVSRIKVQHWGYGKAVYVTHPNGYTTVYAHLQKFSPKIEKYLKRKQYEKESYEIQLFPGSSTLKLDKGEVIAFSGNTGGTGGPHLHFEIRDTATEKIINPLLFGIDIEDTRKPVFKSAFIYPQDDFSEINKTKKAQKLQLIKNQDGTYTTSKVNAHGYIGLGVQTYDQLNMASNKNGIYSLELFVNKQKIYDHCVRTFSFAESKYINLLIDYAYYKNHKQRIQKCFIEPNNKLSIYGDVINNGTFYVEDGLTYQVEIIASDVKGNKTTIKIPIVGKYQEPKTTSVIEQKANTQLFKRADFNQVTKGNATISIPKYSFYSDIDFEFSNINGVVKAHDKTVPLHKSFTLSFDVSDYSKEEQEKLFIGRLGKNGYVSYSYTKRAENKLYTKTKTLGSYTLKSDYTKPTITPINFKNKQWLTNQSYLKVRVKDNLSGVKKYRATIDGKWILMEYEPKKGTLTYNFNDKAYTKAEHTLKIVVSDETKNTNTYIATFYRKK